MILGEEHKQLLTAIIDKHASGATNYVTFQAFSIGHVYEPYYFF